ncbi:peptidylprolyl isomerase [Candidatus Fukatsuia endosymbiont of Tuberolachnus salignus]|uniref:peptidylprolyl isomerase n=1 Tax=Candidatus Fukatsuia endosymbiont of Tuberolachnus salignus TaxID=3077957 RepID=UPI00313E7070
MMEKLRAATNNVALKIIIALIILSFILTGVSGYLIDETDNYAAKVNGKKISRAQLEEVFQGERSRLQQQLGEQFSTLAGNEGYMQQLRQQALEQLINNTLLDQYTEKLGLTVSDEQVKASIRQIPYFQTNNKFDNAKYLNLITSMGYTAEHFARLQRQQVIMKQLLQAVGDSEFILPQEAEATSKLILQQRGVRLATFDINKLQTRQKVTEAELQTYYDQNENNFIAPEEIKISFIEIDAAAIQDKIIVNEKDIQTYYDRHKDNYKQPERKNFSVIQFKTEKEAESTLSELKNGADFATLAKQRSTDIISRKKGGALGWLQPETTVDELKQANLTEKGQLSGVIKSSVGYLLVRLNDIQTEQIKPLSEIQIELAKQVRQEKALDAYYALQQKVSAAATNDNDSLASAEKAAGSKAQQTGWFTRATVPAELNFKPLIQTMFDDTLIGTKERAGGNSDVITVEGDKAFVIRVAGHKAEKIEPFKQVHNEITALVKRQKAQQFAQAEGEKILAALKQDKGAAAMKTVDLSFTEKKTLSRSADDELLTKAIFRLAPPQKNKPVYGLSQDRQGNVVLIELLNVIPGKLSQDEMKTFISQMQQGASGITFATLMANLHQQATIKIGATERQSQ